MTTSKTALARARKVVRDLRAEYADARAAALISGRQLRARGKSGKARLVYEEAIAAACAARSDLARALVRLRTLEALPVEAFGGRVSPTALKRLQARGIGR
jgi:hypothetical protein